MFFDESNFDGYLAEKRAREIAAKVANQIIEDNSTVLYGNYMEDGTAVNFSSTKDKTDTHVLIGIGESEMAIFAPEGKYVKRDRVSDNEEKESLTKLVKQLQGEISILQNRGKDG